MIVRSVRWPPAWELVNQSNELVVRQLPTIKDVNTEAVTRQEQVKIQQTEKTSCML
jgi:hypothetical protein